MNVKLDMEAITAIETALKNGYDVWIYRQKTGVVVASQTRKTIYRTVQRNEQDRAIRAEVQK